jgi:hypothetical protein
MYLYADYSHAVRSMMRLPAPIGNSGLSNDRPPMFAVYSAPVSVSHERRRPMIHEFRTYLLKSGSTAGFLEKTGALIDKRVAYSPLVGFFQSEVGQLNQVVHIWQYESLNERAVVRAKVVEDGVWPPDNSDSIVTQQSDIFIPAPFMPDQPAQREIGPLFELRIYRYPAAATPRVIDAWGERIADRLSLSPAVGVWYSEIGNLNLWAHMWAYESWEHRMESRARFAEIGWPPSSGVTPETMQNSIMLAADFSPVK